MGRYKCAYNCENSSDSDGKFFKFPLYNPRRLKKWLANMKWKDWTPTRFSVLCSSHFEEQCIDRTGKCVKLRDDAVPTIFSTSADTQKRKVSVNPRSKKNKPAGAKVSQKSPAPSPTTTPATSKQSVQNKEPSQTEEPVGEKDPTNPDRWRIIVDEGLMKIDSFPHFFHGDYCVPQDIQWAPDDNVSPESEDPEKVIEVKEPWEWLGLDIRGPLPKTLNEHKYILTVTDYFSKWVEAVPMQSCLPSVVAKHIVDIIAHFGYPLRILSRLPHDIVQKINRELKDQLKVTVALVIYHQQTGTADLITQRLIDRDLPAPNWCHVNKLARAFAPKLVELFSAEHNCFLMVGDLITEHAADWDVYLPAQVFSLCFKEHSKTKERPFSVLCCKGLEPVQSPRGLNYDYSQIRESAFVVR